MLSDPEDADVAAGQADVVPDVAPDVVLDVVLDVVRDVVVEVHVVDDVAIEHHVAIVMAPAAAADVPLAYMIAAQ